MPQSDSLTIWSVFLGVMVILGGLLAFTFALAIFRYRLRKEFGLLKRHMKYRPRPPDRHYRLE